MTWSTVGSAEEVLRLCPLGFGCSRLHNRRSFRLGKLCLRCECCDQASPASKEGSCCSSSGGSNVAPTHKDGSCVGSSNVASQS